MRFVRTLAGALLGLVACRAAPTDRPAVATPPAPAPAEQVAPTPITPADRIAARERWIDERLAGELRAGARPDDVPSGEPDADLVACGLLSAAGRLEEARAGYAALLRLYPHDPVVVIAAARTMLTDRRAADALKLLAELPPSGAAHPELRLLRGRAELEAGDADVGLELLREELATGGRGSEAALALCEYFVARESFGTARAIVTAARRREPTRVDLRLVEAQLLRDVWALDEAAGRLDELLADHAELDVARYQLADVERARGRRDDALALLAAIDASAAWSLANLDLLAALREDLEAPRPNYTARDLLAIVRGDGASANRLRALDALLSSPATRARAIEVGSLQDDAVLRVKVIRAFPADDGGFAEALEIASDDPDPRVRGTAARRARELPELAVAIRLAKRTLDAEEDGYVFRAAHESLVARLGPLVALPAERESDPDGRAQTREAWRRHCPE